MGECLVVYKLLKVCAREIAQKHPQRRYKPLMANARYYVPPISRFLVSALYHEGRHRRMPMTRLVDQLLTDALRDTPGWQLAEEAHRESAAFHPTPPPTTTPNPT